MTPNRFSSLPVLALAGLLGFTGCATQQANVRVGYVLEPNKGLPPGMKAVAVLEADVNEVTDRKWSELAANLIQDLIQDANTRFGANLQVADRKHLANSIAEEDLAAAGITSSPSAGRSGNVMPIQGFVKTEINVKVETHRGSQTTIAGISGWGGDRHGGGDIRTREVETVSRNITVQTAFKLVDTVNNKNWITHAPPPVHQFDRTSTSFLFGSSQTEASLTPRDQIIKGVVNKEAREFVGQFLPCEVQFELRVTGSTNGDCQEGVKMLRAQAFDAALDYFKSALASNSDDDRAAYGAGVAAEAAGDFDIALGFYRRAYGIKPDTRYRSARDRLTEHISRIRRSGVS